MRLHVGYTQEPEHPNGLCHACITCRHIQLPIQYNLIQQQATQKSKLQTRVRVDIPRNAAVVNNRCLPCCMSRAINIYQRNADQLVPLLTRTDVNSYPCQLVPSRTTSDVKSYHQLVRNNTNNHDNVSFYSRIIPNLMITCRFYGVIEPRISQHWYVALCQIISDNTVLLTVLNYGVTSLQVRKGGDNNSYCVVTI